MSSQPSTPQPSTSGSTPLTSSLKKDSNNNNQSQVHYPDSPPLPLETQKYNMVTQDSPSYTMSMTNARNRLKDSHITSKDTSPSFGATEYAHNIYSLNRHTIIDVRLNSKVDRGFFLADNDWTCYRRNYFQVSSSFSLEGVGVLYEGQEYPCVVKDNNHFEELQCFLLGISARLSDCDKIVQLIQHTPKRDKGPQTTPMPKPIRHGGNIGFSSVGSSQSIVTFERLQFKTATANNGKRRAAQQYYIIVVELFAKLKNGNIVTVATTKSAPLVVRGRSPGHYAESDSSTTNASPRQRTAANGTTLPMNNNHTTPPYGRPAAYAGTNAEMFQPNEYIPSYEYHNVSYNNGYNNMTHPPPPPPPPPPPAPISHSNSYPGTSVPMMPQHHYVPGVHDRSQSVSSETYPNHHNEYGHTEQLKEIPHPSPYYWQRNEHDHSTNHNQPHHSHAHEQPQPHHDAWNNRMRMPSNNSNQSSTIDSSHNDSPYMSHPLPPTGSSQDHHPYYSQQQQQFNHPHSSYGHPPISSHSQSLPPPSSTAPDHYGGYHPPQHYDWQPRSKINPIYSHQPTFESDRRHDYSNERPTYHHDHKEYALAPRENIAK
ncbi:hypothetical protein BDB01DRAFT_844977 [Pilobolus umbonatus]|nr:hypothetical protein BDB01DRAFT_844977 [Pilobolus umbonatus]